MFDPKQHEENLEKNRKLKLQRENEAIERCGNFLIKQYNVGEGYIGVSDISDCLHLDFGKMQRYLYSKGMPDECYLSKVVRNGVVEQYRINCDK